MTRIRAQGGYYSIKEEVQVVDREEEENMLLTMLGPVRLFAVSYL